MHATPQNTETSTDPRTCCSQGRSPSGSALIGPMIAPTPILVSAEIVLGWTLSPDPPISPCAPLQR